MIDVHTHILPAMDDGSKELNMTARMICEEAEQGVRMIVATPHFYAHRTKIDEFLERRSRRLQQVGELLRAEGDLPEVAYGAEVYYFPGIGQANRIESLCVKGTDILLLEMPFAQWTDQEYRDVSDLIKKKHLHIVLAHIDRYWGLQKKKQIWDEIMELPLTRQINAESLLSGGGAKRFSIKFLKQHGRVLLGSDCHNLTSRPPNLKQARELIEKKIGSQVLVQMDELAENLYGNAILC
jgi:protein-tyrosine phosphatase